MRSLTTKTICVFVRNRDFNTKMWHNLIFWHFFKKSTWQENERRPCTISCLKLLKNYLSQPRIIENVVHYFRCEFNWWTRSVAPNYLKIIYTNEKFNKKNMLYVVVGRIINKTIKWLGKCKFSALTQKMEYMLSDMVFIVWCDHVTSTSIIFKFAH